MAMKAGEELDALVAERVMGLVRGVDFGEWPEHDWKREEDGSIDIFGYESGDYHNGPGCKRCGWGYCHHCDPWDPNDLPEEVRTCKVSSPKYSTFLPMAWKVFEKLGTGWAVGQNYDNGGKAWWCWNFIDDNDSVGDDTPMLAICKAALLAVLA